MSIVEVVVGAKEVVARFTSIPDDFRIKAKDTLNAWGSELASYIKEDKLSGQVLNRRSGALSRSVHGIEATGVPLEGGAAAGAGVVYAHVHEYGTQGNPITHKHGKYLVFKTLDGKWHKVTSVTMPERSYMRSSLHDKYQSGIDELKATLKEVLFS